MERKHAQRNCLGRRVLLFSLCAVLLTGFTTAQSWSAEEKYPDRPIQMIVPLAPGGAADLASRIVADKVSQYLGQPLISVYKPGGGGVVGTSFAARAKPDGYTIVSAGTSAIMLQTIIRKVDFTIDDLIPAGIWGSVAHQLSVRADSKWKTLQEFIEEAKKSPGKLKIGSYGKFTGSDILIRSLSKHAGIEVTHIPYKSTGEAVTALLGGHIDATSTTGLGGHSASGQIRVLANASDKRMKPFLDVPTFKECGYPIAVPLYYCSFFPKGTPERIVSTFVKAQEKAIKEHGEEITEKLNGCEVFGEFYDVEGTKRIFEEHYKFLVETAKEFDMVEK